MTPPETPIFTRTFDLLTWVMNVTKRFPRDQRFAMTQRLLNATFDLRERLEEANIRRGPARAERLERADEALAHLRLYLRLARQLEWISAGEYRHVSGMTVEVGRLLGGWKKTVSRR
jgi:four helix bundle protein